MEKEKFELSLLGLSDEEIESLLKSDDLNGAEKLAIEREIRYRKEAKRLHSTKATTTRSRKIRRPILFGYEFLDFRSAKLILFLIIPLLIFVIYQSFFTSSKPDYYNLLDRKCNALLVDINTKTTFSQGFDGGVEHILWYEVSYVYKVEGVRYKNKMKLKPNVENINLVKRMRQKKLGQDSIKIIRASYKPMRSSLIFK